MTERSKKIGLDFDGVLHSYVSGYSDYPADAAIPGAQKFCRDLQDRGFVLFVFTARLAGKHWDPVKQAAIVKWLQDNDFPDMPVTGEKLAADLYIDDNGYRFRGDYADTLTRIDSKELLTVWYEKKPNARSFRDETA